MDALEALIDGWRLAATAGATNPTPFEEVRQSISLIEACYQKKEMLSPDWLKWTGD